MINVEQHLDDTLVDACALLGLIQLNIELGADSSNEMNQLLLAEKAIEKNIEALEHSLKAIQLVKENK